MELEHNVPTSIEDHKYTIQRIPITKFTKNKNKLDTDSKLKKPKIAKPKSLMLKLKQKFEDLTQDHIFCSQSTKSSIESSYNLSRYQKKIESLSEIGDIQSRQEQSLCCETSQQFLGHIEFAGSEITWGKPRSNDSL